MNAEQQTNRLPQTDTWSNCLTTDSFCVCGGYIKVTAKLTKNLDLSSVSSWSLRLRRRCWISVNYCRIKSTFSSHSRRHFSGEQINCKAILFFRAAALRSGGNGAAPLRKTLRGAAARRWPVLVSHAQLNATTKRFGPLW